MYMPAGVKVQYKSNFTDTSIGSFTQAASQISEGGPMTTDKMSSIGKDVFFSAGATAVAETLVDAQILAYKLADSLELPSKTYDKSIGDHGLI